MKKVFLITLLVATLCILTACVKTTNELDKQIVNYAMEELDLVETDYNVSLNKVRSELKGTTEYAEYILTLEKFGETTLYQVDVNIVNGEVRYVDVIREI